MNTHSFWQQESRGNNDEKIISLHFDINSDFVINWAVSKCKGTIVKKLHSLWDPKHYLQMLLVQDPILTSGTHCYRIPEDKIHWFMESDFQDIQRCFLHFYYNLIFAIKMLQQKSGSYWINKRLLKSDTNHTYQALETPQNKWLKLKYVKYNSKKMIDDLVHAF